jgi:ectoine hydroxylase-related dioxygenase (phytanoyl-CoA dioxygenase family)
VLSDDQLIEFAHTGYLVVPDVVGEALLAAADAEIDALVLREPPPPDTVGKHFWFLSPSRLPAAHAALRDSGALAIAEELVAPDSLALILDHIQVALNIPPYDHRPGGPHIDGHVRQHPGQIAPDSFTLLAGIFLSDETDIDHGSVWVWPGSHLVHQQLFRDRGTDVLMQTGGHITMLRDPPPLPEPVPVFGRRGDLLLAHFLLGHNSGGNLSPTTRRMLYYRLGCPEHAVRWETTFLDAFAEYAPVRRVLARGMTAT